MNVCLHACMFNGVHAYVDNPFGTHCRIDIPAEGEGGTLWIRYHGGGAHGGVSFNLEYLSKCRAIFKTVLEYELGDEIVPLVKKLM
jgi:hypothetical protein